MVQFRNIENVSPAAKGSTAKKNTRLSFVKISEDQSQVAQSGFTPVSEKGRKILYEEAAAYLNDVLSAVRGRKVIALDRGFEIVRKIVSVNHPRDPLFILALHQDSWRQYVIHHPVNVAIFAIKMANHLGFDRSKQVEIGMAGLLHDVGMAAIPDNILYKQGSLNEAEMRVFKQRPELSFKILRTLDVKYAYLAECAVQVYERIDGSGYPRRLKADEIHAYAQIIGLVAVYDSLIHTRPQWGKQTPFAAVKEIINTGKNRFQRQYLKALLSVFTAFPLQSYVRLNSDAIGRVVETYPDQPFRPKIQIIYDSQKRRVLTEKFVALPDDPLLNIVDSISEEQIRQMTGP